VDDFWSGYDSRSPGPPLTPEAVLAAETALGYKLPESYLRLLRIRNGGHPHRRFYPTSVQTCWGTNYVEIETVYGIGSEEGIEGVSPALIREWDYPAIGVVIACTLTAGPHVVMLDYSDCGPGGKPRVIYLETVRSGDPPNVLVLAPDFETFARGLVVGSRFDKLGRREVLTPRVQGLREWLDEPSPALIEAVAEGVAAQVDTLRSRGIEFYGYALLSGEPYDIHTLTAVANTEADIKVPRTDERYRYYRYSVDEWAHWDHNGFEVANALLAEANARFRSLHTKAAGDYSLDEFEVAHGNALLDAVVDGLQSAKAGGVFGAADPFLVIWISDSGHEIMTESAQRLNSAAVAKEFMREFG
jgi:hypothetical protein